jgi:hypothetical protein
LSSGKELEPRPGKRRREVQEATSGNGDVSLLSCDLAELSLETSQPTVLEAEAETLQDQEQPQEAPQDKELWQEGKEIDEDEGEEEDNVKATKADDAEVKIVKWNVQLAYGLGLKNSPKIATRAAEVRRSFCLRWYKRRLTQSYFRWLHHSENSNNAELVCQRLSNWIKCSIHKRLMRQSFLLSRTDITGLSLDEPS